MNGDSKLKNIAGLFRNARTRTIILLTAGILIFALIIGFMRLTSAPTGPGATGQVQTTPRIQSVPGGFNQAESPEYAQLQEQQNIQEARLASQRGTSAVPTIIRSGELGTLGTAGTPGTPGCCIPCGCPPPGAKGVGAVPLGQSTLLHPGNIVYDAQGRAIGTLGPDGKVRDANGNVIGTVGPDGLVRDANGNVIGGVGTAASGTPVYDANGHLIGTVGPDGKVRDANGNVIGTVGPDGIVRDPNGNILGRAGSPLVGSPVYDAQGRLIGTIGPDGKVRDASGRVIGTVDPDGTVRDLSGNVIGKAGMPLGTPAYDNQGRLIGTVGADGKVRDKNGRIIGTVGPDGVIRDATTGNILGHAGGIVPGTPVYDKQGHLIGTVGPDGLVRDANGNVIGKVGPDGLVRDANGNVVGRVGPTLTGRPIYDSQGRLIGVEGPDGKVRDASGRVIGTVGPDGLVRDLNGNIIGTTAAPGTAPATAATTAGLAGLPQGLGGVPTVGPQAVSALPGANQAAQQLQAIAQRQAQMYSQQQADQLRTQMQGAMAGQAGQLIAAWVSPTQQYVQGKAPKIIPGATAVTTTAVGTTVVGGSADNIQTAPVVKAGTVMFGVLTTAINSDEPGPILGKIVVGKFKGGTVIGTMTNEGQKVLLTFNTLNMPNVPTSISINAVAIDPCTARTAFSSCTNNHYLLRYGSLFASAFLQGYGQAFLTSGQTVVSTGLATAVTTPDLSPAAKIWAALGNVGTRYSAVLGNVFNTPPTVHVYSGTAMGLLFLSDVPPLPTATNS